MPTVSLNGVSHYYDDNGSGEALVMLHGVSDSAQVWEPFYPELSKHFRVIGTDARGMGRSEHVTTMTPSAWVDDLKALLDYLGVEKAHIYGYSRGSRVAMKFAIEYPDRTASLTLQNIHIYLTPDLDARMNRTQGDGTRLAAVQQVQQEKRHGPDWLDVLRNYHNISNTPDFQEYYDLKDEVKQIRCPTLVIQSDEILAWPRYSFDQAYEIKNNMPDRVKLAVVPNLPGQEPLPRASIEKLVIDFAGSLAKWPSPVKASAG